MRFLHTSDWHIGKALRGQSRLDEQAAVLAEIVQVARDRRVDLVLVVGDVFDTAVPTPEAQRLAWTTLLALRETAEVVVLAGNHDHAQALEALRPLAAAAGITLLGRPARPDDGGVVRLRCAGDDVRVAVLPFCSQRSIVRSAQLLAGDASEHAGLYAERVASVVAALASGFDDGAVNLVAAHLMVRGGVLGGGERDAQSIEDYWVSASAFPPAAHYVALGHLHLTQQIAGGCPIWYSGSPLQVDFGEEADAKHVLVVEAHPRRPASEPERVRLVSPRRLRTLRGTLPELAALAGTTGEDWLRVVVREPARAGLAQDVRQIFPHAVDVALERPAPNAAPRGGDRRLLHTPREFFSAYLAEQHVADERVEALFARLLDEASTTLPERV